ncbi:hypothetical protein H6S82_16955 [Planktothrix sp. FACHB-1355]|uniref:Uncharacterized protein n=1 Tax=Aerosakkonema funiforme FACHB-1375 TaxID=2949571 RepID=A0A926VAY7_9CYAN|nr:MULTISPECIES: hypothetical protein [Oscillatoriales]MBD2179592.1 hypothetical protein [Aerosakkonema funiforme FACHB-1375]MBD3560527.1 hypothetical protein [Planktothrix sp. FACHB-1355]
MLNPRLLLGNQAVTATLGSIGLLAPTQVTGLPATLHSGGQTTVLTISRC